eukprot:Pompholyxophrys_sp_v1_NODE_316_length_762_cov_51.837341.p1 type:complete len:113 gc:universal NODE_316_length_762_cov_51.837341:545-207(-)
MSLLSLNMQQYRNVVDATFRYCCIFKLKRLIVLCRYPPHGDNKYYRGKVKGIYDHEIEIPLEKKFPADVIAIANKICKRQKKEHLTKRKLAATEVSLFYVCLVSLICTIGSK